MSGGDLRRGPRGSHLRLRRPKDPRYQRCRDCKYRSERSPMPERARVLKAQGLSNREIAAKLGCAPATVKVWLYRARQRGYGA